MTSSNLQKLFRTENDPTLTVARFVLAAIFIGHGTELSASIGFLLGFLSRIAAFGLLVVMVIAPFANHLYPRFFMNWTGMRGGEGYEYHLLAIALLVGLIWRGSGALSIDRWLSSKGE